MNLLDIFSGIGAFSLGLERAGFRTVAFCEIDPFCRRVLAKHWPEVPRYDDVRSLTADRLRADGISVDVICGGFPCQDISVAGAGAGITGERSGLWSEFARLIGELRPRYVLVENVAALLVRGLDRVLGDLAALGYDAEWHCIPAAAVGAPHRRDRVWIVAYPNTSGGRPAWLGGSGEERAAELCAAVADADCERAEYRQRDSREPRPSERDMSGGCRQDMAEPRSPRLEIGQGTLREWAHAATSGSGIWAVERPVGRVVDGTSRQLDRRKRLIGLGNSLVPQIPELIGRAIVAAERAA